MSVRVRIPIQPTLLQWACHRRGITPDNLTSRFPKLPAWLDGSAQPTLKQLEAFAAATYTPIGYLFLSESPQESVPIPDLRTLGNARRAAPSPDLLETLYLCQQRQAWYRDYASSTSIPPCSFVGSLSIDTNPTDAAEQMRDALRLNPADRSTLRTWEEALRAFAEQAESIGALVMFNGIVGVNTHRKLDPEEFRGFALSDPLAPLVFINGADTKAAQMFTLAHELAHLWCGESALTDSSAADTPVPRLERWCNAVAAELLVPLDDLRRELRCGISPMEEANRLARLFKVSRLVLLRRLYDVGYISSDEMWRLYTIELARLRSLSQSSGGGNFYLTQRIRIGRRFARAVLESTWEGRSSFTEAYRLLGVKNTETLNELGRAVGWVA